MSTLEERGDRIEGRQEGESTARLSVNRRRETLDEFGPGAKKGLCVAIESDGNAYLEAESDISFKTEELRVKYMTSMPQATGVGEMIQGYSGQEAQENTIT